MSNFSLLSFDPAIKILPKVRESTFEKRSLWKSLALISHDMKPKYQCDHSKHDLQVTGEWKRWPLAKKIRSPCYLSLIWRIHWMTKVTKQQTSKKKREKERTITQATRSSILKQTRTSQNKNLNSRVMIQQKKKLLNTL